MNNQEIGARLAEILTLERFEAYLESLDPESVAGYTKSARSCPISQYVVRSEIGPDVYVRTTESGTVEVYQQREHGRDVLVTFRAPSWTRWFVRRIDRGHIEYRQPVSVQRAIDAVQDVKSELSREKEEE